MLLPKFSQIPLSWRESSRLCLLKAVATACLPPLTGTSKNRTLTEKQAHPYNHWLQLAIDPGATRQNNKLLYCRKMGWQNKNLAFFPTFSPAAHRKKYIKTSTKRTPVLQLCVWMAVTILSHSVPSLKPTVDAMICVRRCTNFHMETYI